MTSRKSIIWPWWLCTIWFLCHSSLEAQIGFWTQKLDPKAGRIYSIVETSNGTIYAGTESGVYYTTDAFGSWDSLNAGLTDRYVLALCTDDSSTMFAGTPTGVYRRKEGDSIWVKLSAPGVSFGLDCVPFMIDSNYQILYVSSEGLTRSLDRGQTWDHLPVSPDFVLAYSITSNSNGMLYAADLHTFCQSTDNGQTWSEKYQFPKYSTFIALTVTSSGAILGALGDGYSGKIWRSVDSGATWTDNYYEGYISNFAYDSHGHVFIGIHTGGLNIGGVCRSTDDGITWTDLNEGLPYLDVSALTITKTDFIIAAMKNGTIYQSTQTTVSVQHETSSPYGFSLKQNYPNPFNAATMFSFTLPERQNTLLAIFNILGQEIATLVSTELDAGDHRIIWESNDLPSGIYVCRLSSGRLTSSIKVISIK